MSFEVVYYDMWGISFMYFYLWKCFFGFCIDGIDCFGVGVIIGSVEVYYK